MRLLNTYNVQANFGLVHVFYVSEKIIQVPYARNWITQTTLFGEQVRHSSTTSNIPDSL